MDPRPVPRSSELAAGAEQPQDACWPLAATSLEWSSVRQPRSRIVNCTARDCDGNEDDYCGSLLRWLNAIANPKAAYMPLPPL